MDHDHQYHCCVQTGDGSTSNDSLSSLSIQFSLLKVNTVHNTFSSYSTILEDLVSFYCVRLPQTPPLPVSEGLFHGETDLKHITHLQSVYCHYRKKERVDPPYSSSTDFFVTVSVVSSSTYMSSSCPRLTTCSQPVRVINPPSVSDSRCNSLSSTLVSLYTQLTYG